MKAWQWLISASALAASYGCATTVPAASSRYLAVDAAALRGMPVCFAPARPEPGLAAQANVERTDELCSGAAKKQGITVVPIGSPTCLVATLDWASHPTGGVEVSCGMGSCEGALLHGKTLRMTFMRKMDGKQVAESVAQIESDFASLSEGSIVALCSASFHEFPRALRGERFDAPVAN